MELISYVTVLFSVLFRARQIVLVKKPLQIGLALFFEDIMLLFFGRIFFSFGGMLSTFGLVISDT